MTINGEGEVAALLKRPVVSFVTMGCAKNEVDTQKMQQRLTDAGFDIAGEEDCESADVIVVNTCSFIQSATEESIEAVLEALEIAEMPVVVAGCMPARFGQDLEESLPEAAAFVPCSKEDDIAEVISKLLGVEPEVRATSAHLPQKYYEYVKISDGCDRFCSFCTIPYIRGRYKSFTFEQIEADVCDARLRGVREIVLIAQDTGRWGQDFDEPSSLAWLVDALASKHPDLWFRVMYIQPEGVSDDLLQAMAAHDNVAHYLDIPLQHVQTHLLRAMNRRGTREGFCDLVAHIRDVMPDVTLRTTLMCGFPGETDDDFDALLDFVNEGLFDYIGTFAYSREEGTRAFDLDNQVDEDEKEFRLRELRDTCDAVSAGAVAARVGRTFPILIEGLEEDGQLFGRAICQAPDTDGVTFVDAGKPGDICNVEILDTLMYDMEG
jgi:ribosomal protein S12 methylthiotransferase